MLTPMLVATSGSMPIITNSVMPKANVPKASAMRLFFIVDFVFFVILNVVRMRLLYGDANVQ